MPCTRKLGRTSDSRNAMMRAMVTYLLENGKIETTVTRAKDVRSMAEKMITLGKASDLHTKRQVYAYITCTMNPAENEGQIDAFLARTPGASLEKQWQSTPDAFGSDLMYGAMLKKA